MTWFKDHSHRLLSIREKPEAIALGAAVGVFFGFMPLFGLKTILALLFAWLFGGSKLAAMIAASLHDIAWPLMPILMRWEYDLGYWILNGHLPAGFRHHSHHLALNAWLHWSVFWAVERPLLLGAFLVSTPAGFLTYGLVHWALERRRRKNDTLPNLPN